jgi:hypothetical protein
LTLEGRGDLAAVVRAGGVIALDRIVAAHVERGDVLEIERELVVDLGGGRARAGTVHARSIALVRD